MSNVHDSNPSQGAYSIEPDVDDPAHAHRAARVPGSREPHRVKFAEERNLYVNCDSTTGFREIAEEDQRTWTALYRPLTMSEADADETILKRPSIIRTPRPRTLATEDSDNPFTRGGELSRKADFILRHSTFSRTGLRILDPDCVDSSATTDEELPGPLPFSPEVSDRNDPTPPPAQLNTEEEEEGVGLSDGENGDEPCSVTTSLVSPADRDLDQATVDIHLARLNGKHPPESATRVINSRTSRYESSSPVLDSGTVSSRTKKCSCCLLQ